MYCNIFKAIQDIKSSVCCIYEGGVLQQFESRYIINSKCKQEQKWEPMAKWNKTKHHCHFLICNFYRLDQC